jgi:hypothetical protein
MNPTAKPIRELGRVAYTTALIVVLAGFGANSAHAKQPLNVSPLLGTWVSTTADGGVAQVVITDVGGNFQVHPYGSCSPTFCDWGSQPAWRFSSGVTSTTAIGFQVTINSTLAASYLQGHLIKTPTGQTLLEITTQRRFMLRGDQRSDYELTERFRRK